MRNPSYKSHLVCIFIARNISNLKLNCFKGNIIGFNYKDLTEEQIQWLGNNPKNQIMVVAVEGDDFGDQLALCGTLDNLNPEIDYIAILLPTIDDVEPRIKEIVERYFTPRRILDERLQEILENK